MAVENSPLLSLLEQRWQDEIKDIPDPTPERPSPRPSLDATAVSKAAREYAEAWASDPHAYARCRHYLRQGFWRVDDVLRECRGLIASRKAQGVLFPIARSE